MQVHDMRAENNATENVELAMLIAVKQAVQETNSK